MEGLKKVGKERFLLFNKILIIYRPADPVRFLGQYLLESAEGEWY